MRAKTRSGLAVGLLRWLRRSLLRGRLLLRRCRLRLRGRRCALRLWRSGGLLRRVAWFLRERCWCGEDDGERRGQSKKEQSTAAEYVHHRIVLLPATRVPV